MTEHWIPKLVEIVDKKGLSERDLINIRHHPLICKQIRARKLKASNVQKVMSAAQTASTDNVNIDWTVDSADAETSSNAVTAPTNGKRSDMNKGSITSETATVS